MQASIVILAAGIGSRYGGLKQMDPVGPSGEFIIDYSVYDALRAGLEHVVFVIRRELYAAFEETIGSRVARHAAVDYVFQELDDLPPGFSVPAGREKPWGTAQAVLTAAACVNGPFVVINADDFYGRAAYETMAAFLQRTASDPAAYAMVGYRLHQTLSEHGSVARGICRSDATGRLLQLDELTDIEKDGDAVRCSERILSGDELASMNFWGFKPSFFDHVRERFPAFLEAHADEPKAEFFMPVVVDQLIQEGQASVTVLETTDSWLGMTNPEDKQQVTAAIRGMVASGRYPESLWE